MGPGSSGKYRESKSKGSAMNLKLKESSTSLNLLENGTLRKSSAGLNPMHLNLKESILSLNS